jgi:hypothetical protein
MIPRSGRGGPGFESLNGPFAPHVGKSLWREKEMSAVGFEPTRISPPELESGALDRSAKLTHMELRLPGFLVAN